MMAALFLLYGIAIYLSLKRQKKAAFTFTIITLILCILMFMHHATDKIPVRL